MTTTIDLDGDKYEVKIDAYFPIFYRDLMGEDFFADQSAIHNNGDNLAALRLAFAAMKYADESNGISYKDWLQKYDIQSAIEFAMEAYLFMLSTLKQKSESKKK